MRIKSTNAIDIIDRVDNFTKSEMMAVRGGKTTVTTRCVRYREDGRRYWAVDAQWDFDEMMKELESLTM